jgi:hypothetical protein
MILNSSALRTYPRRVSTDLCRLTSIILKIDLPRGWPAKKVGSSRTRLSVVRDDVRHGLIGHPADHLAAIADRAKQRPVVASSHARKAATRSDSLKATSILAGIGRQSKRSPGADTDGRLSGLGRRRAVIARTPLRTIRAKMITSSIVQHRHRIVVPSGGAKPRGTRHRVHLTCRGHYRSRVQT